MRRLCINFCAASEVTEVDTPFLQVRVASSIVSDRLDSLRINSGAAVWCELNILVNSGRAWVGAGGGAAVSLWWLKMVTGSVLICATQGLGGL